MLLIDPFFATLNVMSLHAVFSPRSIAIIGASTQVGSVGNDLVKNLTIGFTGDVYPVNPKGGELYGLPVYPSIKAIPNAVELAVIAVPAAVVPQVLTEAGKKKVKAAVVISAGFKEVGNVDLENQVAAIAKKYKITLVGPNCLGVMNPHLKMNASFAPTLPPEGSIAFLSQSGALGTAIIDYANTENLGFSKFLSLGNKATLNEATLLEYLANDPQTKVILMYIEQLSDLHCILEATKKINRVRHPKPIIVLKSGQTAQGAAAASSHTGALAGNDELYDALFRQAGIIRACTIQQLFLYAECFISNPILKKDRVAVVTNAGGLGVLVTDAIVKENLELAHLSPQTQKDLQTFLPSAANIHNPIDMLGDARADRYEKTLSVVSNDENVDALVVLLTPQSMTDPEATAQAISACKKKTSKPIVVSFLGGERVKAGIGILHHDHVATTTFPESSVESLSVLHRFSIWKKNQEKPHRFNDFNHRKIHQILHADRGKNNWLAEDEVLEVLEAAGLPVVPWATVTHIKQLNKAITKCGKTVVLKIISPDILHKSDVGGVMLNVPFYEAYEAYDQLLKTVKENVPKAKIDGVLIMEQVTKKGQEIIVGGVRDPQLGALIGCGMGGVFTEVFKDAAFGLAPLTIRDIDEMLERLKVTMLLKGVRGQTPFDLKSLKECVSRISQLFSIYPQIAELDINPVLVFHRGKGAVVVDARLRVF